MGTCLFLERYSLFSEMALHNPTKEYLSRNKHVPINCIIQPEAVIFIADLI